MAASCHRRQDGRTAPPPITTARARTASSKWWSDDAVHDQAGGIRSHDPHEEHSGVNPSTVASTRRLFETLSADPVVGILRAREPGNLVAAAEVIADAGIRALEFPLTTPGALDALRTLHGRRPDLLAGAGTVITPADAADAVDAGAQFLVAPCIRPDTLAAAAGLGVPLIPGAFTATEIALALELGAELIKLFPATPGPSYLRALRDPLPQARLVPTGGVGIDAIPDFLRAGAFAVALGSPLLADALETRDFDALAERAARAVTASRR
jgi:2-dehydro-3-deoxyphosphogluconate aldolase / (4S)-4-hydroxy-2-oxoglutarate aldolase